ncbi:MAG: glycosyl hydrolase, partial [Thermoanaerobaculia bacterium]
YIPRRPLGGGEKANLGTAFFTAPNPPFGAVFTYYLKDELKTQKAVRQKQESEIAKEGGDTPYPGWDALQEEAREEDPAILLIVRDASGNVVRRLTGPSESGFHRVAWDLRYPLPDAITSLEPVESWMPRFGPLSAPGTYTVTLAQRVAGEVTEVGEPQGFEVNRLKQGTLPGSSPEEAVAFSRELAETQRQAQGVNEIFESTGERLKLIKHALLESTVSDTTLDDEVRALEQRLLEMRQLAFGNEVQDELGEPVPHTIGRRLSAASTGTMMSTYGPTPNHRQTLDIAQEELAEVRARLAQLVDVDLPAFEQKLEAAGVPWTKGRAVPGL